MLTEETENYILENFEGPLDLLCHLVTLGEIDIYALSILDIIQQFIEKLNLYQGKSFAKGAEFIALAAALLNFKAKTLLPSHEQIKEDSLEEESDKNFEIIHQLIDYCRFKQAAKELSLREERQSVFYSRAIVQEDVKKKLGIDHISLEDLAALFQQILSKTTLKSEVIDDDDWTVADKIIYLKERVKAENTIPFATIFHSLLSRMELIVTFLALLELIKSGCLRVAYSQQKEASLPYINIHRSTDV